MKKLILLIVLCLGVSATLHAQKLSREEFLAKKKAYITEQAELTESEAAKFFPLYFELRGKMRKLENDQNEESLKGKPAENDYAQVLEKKYNSRIESAKLEKHYYYKFKAFLTNEKIYKIQKAEIDFHRTILKKMVR